MEQIAKATARETVIKIVAALTMGTVWTAKTVLQDYAVILVKHTLLNRNKVFNFDRKKTFELIVHRDNSLNLW